ncbi:MAG: response regulator [Deltaproteobacteria bacterium]|nr:response regulator [Deltaproteobacteria bacterium]
MTVDVREKTAIGIARARFMEALPRKSNELKSAIATLSASPNVARLREEMRRRLHALYASAQVFREEALAGAVKQAIDRIDRARDEQRPISPDDIDRLNAFADSIPRLKSSRIDSPSVLSRPSFRLPFITSQAPEPSVTAPALQMPALDSSGSMEETGQQQDAQSDRDRTIDGDLLSERALISVLIVEEAQALDAVLALLPVEQFEVQTAFDAEEALRIARSSAPDLVLVSREVLQKTDVDLIGRMRSDPLTGFIPVILTLSEEPADVEQACRQTGADSALIKPLDGSVLVRNIIRFVDGSAETRSEFEGITEATVGDIANRVAAEIRRGLIGSLRTGQDQTIPLGDSPEILAATWSTIGRIRSHLSHQSRGSVQFRDAPLRGGPALLALSEEDDFAARESQASSLEGKRILVADDDPAVLWFFTGLLREAGASVLEAKDGKEALETARIKRPDVIISDILMPEIDGFTLCRELKKDFLLADVPVILISWKEDYIQRMRELSSGANGYLLKETGSHQILKCVHDVLRPRARLENQLDTDAEVRGRLDRLGVLSLLEVVSKKRPDARVVLRDARNLFELDLRQGNLVELTQTASDGSFLRGEDALQHLLGMASGRFTVTHCSTSVKNRFHEPLAKLLQKNANRLAALLDCISDASLMQVDKISFHRDRLKSILDISPKSAHEIVTCLEQGQSPWATIIAGTFAPQQLESLLDDLARRGAITQVLGTNGIDMVSHALRVREQSPSTLFHSTPPSAAEAGTGDPMQWLIGQTARPGSKASMPAKEREKSDGRPDQVSDSDSETAEPQPAEEAPSIARISDRPEGVIEDSIAKSLYLDKVEAERTELWEDASDDASTERAASRRPPQPKPDGCVELEPKSDRDNKPPVVPCATTQKPPPVPFEARAHQEKRVAEQPSARLKTEALPKATEALEKPPGADLYKRSEPPRGQDPQNGCGARVPTAALPQTEAKRDLPEPSSLGPVPYPFDQPPEPEVRKKGGLLLSLALFAVFAAILSGWILLGNPGKISEVERWGKALSEDTVIPGPKAQKESPPDGVNAGVTKASSKITDDTEAEERYDEIPGEGEPLEEEISKHEQQGFGRSLPFIDRGRNVEVSDDQGLLVIEVDKPQEAPLIMIGEKNIGRAPVEMALSAGRHELIFKRDDETSYRYIVIAAGKTLIVRAP